MKHYCFVCKSESIETNYKHSSALPYLDQWDYYCLNCCIRFHSVNNKIISCCYPYADSFAQSYYLDVHLQDSEIWCNLCHLDYSYVLETIKLNDFLFTKEYMAKTLKRMIRLQILM